MTRPFRRRGIPRSAARPRTSSAYTARIFPELAGTVVKNHREAYKWNTLIAWFVGSSRAAEASLRPSFKGRGRRKEGRNG